MQNNSNLRDRIAQIQTSLIPLARSSGQTRNKIIINLAENLIKSAPDILSANAKDVEKAKNSGLSAPILDRLALSENRLGQLAEGLKNTASLPDPLGRIEDFSTLGNGLTVGRMRIPLGLIAFICEARPGAVAEAASMALKSGNAIIIKPGQEAAESTAALSPIISQALSEAGLPPYAATILPTLDREDLKEILKLDDLIDLVIPRGGESLIRFVTENSRIPVLKHFKGVCHLYVDQNADLEMAEKLVINSKTNRPATCNTLECLLVQVDEAPRFLKSLGTKLKNLNVEMAADDRALTYLPMARPAKNDDFGREYLDLTLAIAVVDNIEGAINHITKYGSRHTEAIVTRDQNRAKTFLKSVDAGCVMVNASTRLNDGGCLGLGAEIGISTSKLHAYGPMGLKELTTTKFIVMGEGHLRT